MILFNEHHCKTLAQTAFIIFPKCMLHPCGKLEEAFVTSQSNWYTQSYRFDLLCNRAIIIIIIIIIITCWFLKRCNIVRPIQERPAFAVTPPTCEVYYYYPAEHSRNCSRYQFADPGGMTGLVGQPGLVFTGRSPIQLLTGLDVA